MEKQTFSKEKKLKIIKEASEYDVKSTVKKNNIYPVSYYS
jgi:hypothetical protein